MLAERPNMEPRAAPVYPAHKRERRVLHILIGARTVLNMPCMSLAVEMKPQPAVVTTWFQSLAQGLTEAPNRKALQ